MKTKLKKLYLFYLKDIRKKEYFTIKNGNTLTYVFLKYNY